MKSLTTVSELASKYSIGDSSSISMNGFADKRMSLHWVFPIGRMPIMKVRVPGRAVSSGNGFTQTPIRPWLRFSAVVVSWMLTPMAAIAPKIALSIDQFMARSYPGAADG